MPLTCLYVFWHHLNYLDVQHGKDFEAIQNNIAMKYKKRGKPANMVKNKEQVRHFYYRTWHKISKHIDFANGKLPFICQPKKRWDLTESQWRWRAEQYLFFYNDNMQPTYHVSITLLSIIHYSCQNS